VGSYAAEVYDVSSAIIDNNQFGLYISLEDYRVISDTQLRLDWHFNWQRNPR